LWADRRLAVIRRALRRPEDLVELLWGKSPETHTRSSAAPRAAEDDYSFNDRDHPSGCRAVNLAWLYSATREREMPRVCAVTARHQSASPSSSVNFAGSTSRF